MHKSIKKYYSTYAEEESKSMLSAFESIKFGIYDSVVIIPARFEEASLSSLFLSLSKAAEMQKNFNVLVIIIINNNHLDLPEKIQENQRTLLFWKDQLKGASVKFENNSSFGSWCGLDLFFWDKSSSGHSFTNKQGVGLARKLGSDFAVGLFLQKSLKCKYIITTDADVLVPDDYFEGYTNLDVKNISAQLYPFIHQPFSKSENLANRALALYDNYLHYYVEGLRQCNSPYAFYTIGSTISFSIEGYCQVRGFAKKKLAGEDFYFLNKLRKIASIHQRQTKAIIIRARLSQRVPFGTGPAVSKICQTLLEGDKYQVFHPLCFYCLKVWLNCAENYCTNQSFEIFTKELKKQLSILSHILFIYSWEEYEYLCQERNFMLLLEGSKVLSYLPKFDKIFPKNSKRLFHEAFDGFKTLKFLNYIKKNWICEVSFNKLSYSKFSSLDLIK